MKSWNDVSDETMPLTATTRRRVAADERGGVRIRALALTLATCMAGFGLHAWYTDTANDYLPPAWQPVGAKEKPFAWSQVRVSVHVMLEWLVLDLEAGRRLIRWRYSLPCVVHGSTSSVKNTSIELKSLSLPLHFQSYPV
jgi:hypothetical protein